MHRITAFATITALLLMPVAATGANRLPAVAVVVHVDPPVSADDALATADVAVRSPEELGEPLAAQRSHPGAHLSFALSPAFLASLDRAARGDFNAPSIASIVRSGATGQDRLLGILARHRPLDTATARSASGARYLTLATSASNELAGGRSAPFSGGDMAEFAEDDARVVLAAAGFSSSSASPSAALADLARTDRQIEDALKAGVRNGTVDVVALPDDEPVLPLLLDAGGKSTADSRNIVAVGAARDAQVFVDEAERAASAFAASSSKAGFYSPYGAYDDALGPVIKSSGASYALFSDRVVRGAGGAGSQSGIDAADAAALRAYALTVDRGVTLSALFWSEADSADVDTALGADTAMAQQLIQAAHRAAARDRFGASGIFVLRLHADGAWSQRPDARTVVDRFIAALASGQAGASTTPRDFIRAHPPVAPAYGFPPAAEAGSLSYWMGTPDQASLWNALAAARKAAGGDAALNHPDIKPLLMRAEAGAWYAAVDAPPAAAGDYRVEAFRELIAAVYRAAGATPPASIAPTRGTPESAPTPSSSPTLPPPP